MKKISTMFLVVAVALGAGCLFSACGDDITCAAGTVKEGGKCVPLCDTSEYWDGTECQPACEEGEYWDGTQCQPGCEEGTYWDGTGCVDIPECDTGTTFNPDTNRCVPDSICGEGAHPECTTDGDTYNATTKLCEPSGTPPDCVSDTWVPDADVGEGAENNDPQYEGGVPAEITLPAVGGSLSLGGVIGTPADLDDDGEADADFDGFIFDANAGTYLHIRATSEGVALPAFGVMGIDDEGYIVYDRWAINPNGLDSEREVYLPLTGTYVLLVSDYNNVVGMLFGGGDVPVGGDGFTYYLTVEALAAPTPTDVASANFPASESGNFDDYVLGFYNVTGLLKDDVINMVSAGQPVPDTENNVFPALLVFGVDGQLLTDFVETYGAQDDLYGMFAALADGAHLVVVDYWLIAGPARQYAVDMSFQPVTDCDTETCDGGTFAEGDFEMLGFSVAAGELLALTATGTGGADLALYLLDERLFTVAYADATYEDEPESVHAFTPVDTRMYVVVMDYWGSAGSYDMEYIQPVLETITAGTEYTGATLDMPANFSFGEPLGATGPAMGYNVFAGVEGKIAYFEDLVGNGGGWDAPLAAMVSGTTLFNGVYYSAADQGYYLWVNPFAKVPAAGTYEYVVVDGVDLSGLTYTTTLRFLDLADLGMPTQATPAEALAQDLDANVGAAFLDFAMESESAYIVTVTPTTTSDIQLQVYSQQYCFLEGGYIYPDPEGVGFFAEAAPYEAAAAGDPVSFMVVAPYEGPYNLMVRNLNGAATDTTFDVLVEKAACLPGSTRCADGSTLEYCNGYGWMSYTCTGGCQEDEDTAAAACILDGGDTCAAAVAVGATLPMAGVFAGSTAAMTDTVGSTTCAGSSPGPDMFYSLDLSEGDTVDLTLNCDFDSLLYLFTDCGDPDGSCVAGDDVWVFFGPVSGERVTYTVGAGEGGTFYVGVDGYSSGGNCTLDVLAW